MNITYNNCEIKKSFLIYLNVDWGNLNSCLFARGIENTVISTSGTQIASLTIPITGKYLIIASGAISGGGNGFITWTLLKGSTQVARSFTTISDTDPRPSTTIFRDVECLAGDNIIFTVIAPGTGGNTLNRPNGIAAIRMS